MAVYIAGGEEEDAHEFAVAALCDARDGEAAEGFPDSKEEGADANGHGYTGEAEFRANLGHELKGEEECDAADEHGAEEPVGSSEEGVVAAHVEDDAPKSLHAVVEAEGARDASLGIAELLAEDAHLEP